VGLDGHTPEIFDRILESARHLELYDVQVTIQTAFPGTPLYARLLREGRLLEPTDWRRCTLFDVNYRPTGMSPDELAAGFRTMVVPLYSAELTDWRRQRFKARLHTLHPGKGMTS